jgi:hypothetical protein
MAAIASQSIRTFSKSGRASKRNSSSHLAVRGGDLVQLVYLVFLVYVVSLNKINQTN